MVPFLNPFTGTSSSASSSSSSSRSSVLALLGTRILVGLYSLNPIRLFFLVIVGIFLMQRTLSSIQRHKVWTLAPIANIDRDCPQPSYPTLESAKTKRPKEKICLTTLTDEKDKAFATRLVGWRNFDGLLKLTWDNKQNYAKKHGYFLFDESDQLDKSRPPSWSKIRAVNRLLNEENCTWVYWLDADTVIMNSEKRIEAFLPSVPSLDLLLSVDDGGGYNAGAWLVHNTPWARQFLQEWWDMRSFVKVPGLAKSGDNDALKYKLQNEFGDEETFNEHILAPPRCTFNSYVKFIAPSMYAAVAQTIKEQDFYMAEAYYHRGDFVAHVAGVDNKVETLKMLLKAAK